MPDPLDSLMKGLYQHTEKVAWAGTEAVRSRGRERARNHRGFAVMATAATVGLAATGGVVLADRAVTTPQPGATSAGPVPTSPATPPPTAAQETPPTTGQPTAPPTTGQPTTPATTGPARITTPPVSQAPALREIPTAAMLRPSDVGAGYTAEEPLSNDGVYAAWMVNCAAASGWTSVESTAMRVLTFTGSNPVFEQVTAYPAGQGRQFLADVLRSTATCATHTQVGTDRQVRITLVGRDFAGQESLLIRVVAPDQERLKAFVRQGDVVVELEQAGVDAAALRSLAVRAAGRLCAATPTC